MPRILPALTATFFLTACGAPPQINEFEIEMNPGGSVPLGALAKVRTDVPSRVHVAVSGPSEFEATSSAGLATEHEIIVVGMRPDSDYSLTLTAVGENGYETTSQPRTISTDPLPEDFPPLDVQINKTESMEPGVTLVPVFRRPLGGNNMDDFGLAIVLDSDGEVIWYYQADHSVGDLLPTPQGTFIYQRDRDGKMAEIDLLGRPQRHWHTTRIPKEDLPEGSIPVDADTFHHDMVLMPSGNFLMLSTEVRHFEAYPSSADDPNAPLKPANVIADVILEFTQNGEVVNRWPLADLIDPMRIGYDSLSTGFYREAYKNVLEEPGYDWSHCNSIAYDAADNAAMVSCRPLDVVIKLELASGELKWLLGAHGGWGEPWQGLLLQPPDEDFVWNAHQHSANPGPDGRVLMFDNGNYRAVAFEPKMPADQHYSRAVEFEVDQDAMTVRKTWSYGEGEDRFFSSFISAASYMPTTGNILVVDGARSEQVELPDGESANRSWARVVELTYDQAPTKVFEVVIEAPDMSWLIYRSRRLPGLYPQ